MTVMDRRLFKFLSDRTIGFKLSLAFVSVILATMVLLAYVSYRVMDSRLMEEAHEKIGIGMKAAWTEYYIHGDQMRYGMLQAASMEEVKNAFKRRDGAYLKEQMTRWKRMRPYVDVWAVLDEKGRVISRLGSGHAGDGVSLNGMVERAIIGREPVVSTEILPGEFVALEGPGLLHDIYGGAAKKTDGADIMALLVVTPVLNEKNSVIGVILTGDVLNIDSHISGTLANKIPGIFTTVSASGVRISTNLTDTGGRSLVGTRIPEAAASEVFYGRTAFKEWSFPGMAYISIFEPIKDSTGKVIGSLDVGVAKERLWAIQKENQGVIILITVFGIGFSIVASLFLTYRITKPVKTLKEKLGAFAAGDMSVRIEAGADAKTADELKMVSGAFNSMMDDVLAREEEKRRHLEEIENRNREYMELNEELKTTNEELEVAYEETQSQTEELHAINEELRLLNEDLDRKNVELQKANRTITLEEEEIKKVKDKLRLIYDGIRDHILLVGYDLDILEANRHFTETFRLNEPQAAGTNVYSYFGLAPRINDCPVRRSIETMSPVEAELTAPDGKVFRWHSFPLADANEEHGKAVVYIKDITEYRFLTNKLIQTDKLSSLGELVSGVAHELNNPLTGIMCFSELLLEDRLGDDVKIKLRKINDASHRCKKIIDNLLTFSRWKKPEKKYEDVNKVIRESVELRAYQLKVDNIELELDLDSSNPSTMIDENQIQQVFLNLINNARDAIKDGGEAGRIKISSRRMDDRFVIRFEDTGKGIPKEIANRIFDPFFTTKEVGKGTGLGLSISYGIINEHGGSIYASSLPGGGAAFTVELPVIGKKTALLNENKITGVFRLDRARTKGLKALILDDERIVLDLLNEILTYSGFNVDRTLDGTEALEKIREKDYDIIISDIKMPGLDGKGFYREVRNIRPEALKKIIFISGDSVNKETQEFLRETGNISIKKPFTIDQLNAVISQVIF